MGVNRVGAVIRGYRTGQERGIRVGTQENVRRIKIIEKILKKKKKKKPNNCHLLRFSAGRVGLEVLLNV